MRHVMVVFILVIPLFFISVISEELVSYGKEDTCFAYTVTKRHPDIGRWITEVNFFKHNDIHDGPYKIKVEQSEAGDNLMDITVSVTGPTCRNPTFTKTPNDYELFEGVGYYKFYNMSVFWDDARRICEKDGSHLVIINSNAESNVMKTILERHKSHGSYSGFHDRFVEGEYTTIFGAYLKSTGFSKWSERQPDNFGGNEDCGYIFENGLLNDIHCYTKRNFICEFQPLKISCNN